jgi:hypothetical protein
MKRILPVILLVALCVFMLASCGLSATQIQNNLKDEGYTTEKWTDEEIESNFASVYDSEDFEITSVIKGYTETNTILIVQLISSTQARAFKDEIDEIITDESIQVTIEGRLALIGQKEDINIALGKGTEN